MTLLKELIVIPDFVDLGKFREVISDGISNPKETVDKYHVTENLQKKFADALNFIGLAVRENKSRACYLHGSFGSGKSHFMAILNLILNGNTDARAIPELAGSISKNSVWMDGKKILLVPFHMLDSESCETGILGGYGEYIKKIHPDAPIPGVYRAESLFEDAKNLKNRMGADSFFKGLNEGESSGGGFGTITRSWDDERFQNAILQRHGEEDRSLLISALSKTYFGAFGLHVENDTKSFLNLEDGLSVISRHAKSIGYDAIILFLDELILWLASRANDLDFVTRECAKLVKLIEAERQDRPAPIISFIARQRDLSELIGESVPGANKMNFKDILSFTQGKFHLITLEDNDLPSIAQKRVLIAKSDSARSELNNAFDSFVNDSQNKQAVDSLLTRNYTSEMFRQVYPFSPALIQTLVAISSLLQRERTALKIMAVLLAENREELTVGDIIPVGDLFDVVAHGESAFNPEMKEHFENANNLYQRKLLPELEKKHNLPWDEYKNLPADDPARRSFRNDDRLAKTLLLSALVPDVEALRGLTAKRLAYLNHGTIKVVNAGEEGAMVLSKVRAWARMIGEIKIGEGSDPTITVQLSDVDTDTIIKKAEREDNQGNRTRLVRQMLSNMLNIQEEGEFEQFYDWQWKNTSRSCIVLFRNIRELATSSIQNADDNWKLIIDFPFDQADHGPRDDLSKLQGFQESHPDGTKTICWLPSFFSNEASADLGRLVCLNHILLGDRFESYVGHLSPQDRPAARASLDSQRNVLSERVRNHIESVYGLVDNSPESLHPTHRLELNERFVSLENGLTLRPPTKPVFSEAMEQLLDQALSFEFPGAPEFEVNVNHTNVKKVFEYASLAAQTKDRRIEVETRLRNIMRGIANPLRIGEMAHDATHFVIGEDWKNHFIRKMAVSGGELTTDAFKEWIDDPKPMGLPNDVKNLLIMLFAEQTDHAFYLHGSSFEPTLKSMPNCELRPEAKVDGVKWNTARDLAASIFGVSVSELNSAANMARLAEEVKNVANQTASSITVFRGVLSNTIKAMQVDANSSKRLQTVDACITLMTRVQASSDNNQLITTIAETTIPTTKEAMGMCCKQSEDLGRFLKGTNLGWFENIQGLVGDKKTDAEKVLHDIRSALVEDEHVIPLKPAFRNGETTAVRLLKPEPVVGPTNGGISVLEQNSKINLNLNQAEKILQELKEKRTEEQTIRVDVSWVIEKATDS